MSTKSPSFAGHVLRVAFVAADTDTSFSHDLGRTPLAVFPILPDTVTAIVYKGTVAWTSTTISLKSTVANVGATVLIV